MKKKAVINYIYIYYYFNNYRKFITLEKLYTFLNILKNKKHNLFYLFPFFPISCGPERRSTEGKRGRVEGGKKAENF